MKNMVSNRIHLESLSTNELIYLAESNGIDIPEGLNRRFIIGELLDLQNDFPIDSSSDLAESKVVPKHKKLPLSYNETLITALLRDPGWIFVYWDFHSSVSHNTSIDFYFLRIHSLNKIDDSASTSYYDVKVGISDRKWYVHFPGNGYYSRIDLYYTDKNGKEIFLAKTELIEIPYSDYFDFYHSKNKKNSPILELSGITELRKNHFRNHRESF